MLSFLLQLFISKSLFYWYSVLQEDQIFLMKPTSLSVWDPVRPSVQAHRLIIILLQRGLWVLISPSTTMYVLLQLASCVNISSYLQICKIPFNLLKHHCRWTCHRLHCHLRVPQKEMSESLGSLRNPQVLGMRVGKELAAGLHHSCLQINDAKKTTLSETVSSY